MRKNVLLVLLALCALSVVVACGGGDEAPAPAADTAATEPATGATGASGSGVVTGKITYAGPDPDAPIPMDADPNCLSLHTTPVDTNQVAVTNGNLGNVFVYVKGGLEGQSFPVPAEKVLLDQQGCLYTPHVLGAQVGQTVVIKNSDAFLHNVHALPTQNQEFNQAQPVPNMEIEKVFDKPEVMVHVKCDVHPWMSAYVGVLPHPYFATSGEDGGFSIDGLPAGTYTLEAWHETLGTQEQQVTVADGQTATANFDFKPKA